MVIDYTDLLLILSIRSKHMILTDKESKMLSKLKEWAKNDN